MRGQLVNSLNLVMFTAGIILLLFDLVPVWVSLCLIFGPWLLLAVSIVVVGATVAAGSAIDINPESHIERTKFADTTIIRNGKEVPIEQFLEEIRREKT